MEFSSKIYIAGHHGMAGSAISRNLLKRGFTNIVTRTSAELDLRDQSATNNFFATENPEYVFLAAAKVGGIHANNTYRGSFLYDNLMIQSNAIHASYLNGVKKLLFLGSTCIYPKLAVQPMCEDALLTGGLEPTNEPYAIAKIAGIKLCESYNRQYGVDYRSVMPTNLFGPGDNYHPDNSHVIPALIRRFHEAKLTSAAEVKIWGTGTPRREFLYVDDMAFASIFVMCLEKSIYDAHTIPMRSHINVGFGDDVTIAELANLVGHTVGYQGRISFNVNKPDGPPRKLIDSHLLRGLGWEPQIALQKGLKLTYDDFIEHDGALILNKGK